MNGNVAVSAPGGDVWLRRLSSVVSLSRAAQEAAAEIMSLGRPIPARDHIIRDGNRETSIKVLISGFACRYKFLPAGRRQITAFVLPGDLCDFGFVSSSPASQGVMALSPSIVGAVDVDRFASIVEEYPDLMAAVLRCAAIEQNATQELLLSLGGRNALQRVGHLLCELHFRMQSAGLLRDGQAFDLPVTQSELGEALGLSTVHVNRTVQTLRKLGLATWRDRVVSLPNPPGLAALSGFDPAYLKSEMA